MDLSSVVREAACRPSRMSSGRVQSQPIDALATRPSKSVPSHPAKLTAFLRCRSTFSRIW